MNRTEYQKAAGDYINSLRRIKSRKTIENYRKVLLDFDSHLRYAKSEQIRRAEIETYRNAVVSRGASVNTARQYIIDLSAFFGWCVRHNLIDETPVSENEIPDAEQIRYDLLSDDEITSLLTGFETKSKYHVRNTAIIVLLLQTCMRNAEIRALRLCDINFDDGYITVVNGKGNKLRYVPFPEQSRKAVTAYLNSGIRPRGLEATAPLFGTTSPKEYGSGKHEETGNPADWHELTSQSLNGIVKRYTRKHCGHEVHAHTIRHAGASKLDDMGVPMRDIQKILGHSSIETTEQIYVTVLNRNKAAKSVKSAWDGE